MFTWTTLCTGTLGGVAVAYLTEQYLKNSRRQVRTHPLPPGPAGLPWIGNVIGINADAPWMTYSEWAKSYGDLMYTRLLGKEVIIINSEKVAKELLEHRSRNYSDRPYLVTNELCGADFNSGLLPYGDTWRLHRRFFHLTFSDDAVSRFRPLQYRKSCQLLRQLLEAPTQFPEHVFDYTASLILNGVYDYDPASRKDEIAQAVAKALEVIVAALRPETALIVGALPVLLYLPSWLPGMSFKKKMAASKKFASQYIERPFECSVKKLSDVGSAPAMIHDSLQNVAPGSTVADEAWMTELKHTAATAFLAGAETSTSIITTFFLMMIMNPRVQEKAQEQIDLVLGGDRLPTIDDRASLPYVDAVLRELYRCSTVLPLSIPRSVVEDDLYSGFHIPKGAIVLTNLWSMAHDESKYPRPHEFIPERHLDDEGSLLPNSTEHLAFGFGRRICPGRYFADTSVWSVIASVLAIFHISKAKDANGVEIPVEPKFSSGITTHPLPFACSILPRMSGMDSQKLEQLIATNMV